MREKLTLSMLTRQFAHLLGCMIDLEYSPEPASFIAGQRQAHADTAILPAHLYKSLDDVSEDVLMPAAYKLAEHLKADNAAVSFDLHEPPIGYEFSIHRYNGISVRGMALRDQDFLGPNEGDPPIVVDLFRFDVLYREATLQ